MQVDFKQLSPNQRYHVMTQVVVPRPIAWVLTDSSDKSSSPSYNLAPFSYFNAVSSDPPLVLLSVGSKPDGQLKDTRRNILQKKALVIHIPSVSHAKMVTESAATMEYGKSEVEKLDLALIQDEGWPLPRLTDVSIAMACRLYDSVEIGPAKQGLIFCEVDTLFVKDEAITRDAKDRIKVDAGCIEPLSRLGANEYASFGEVFKIERPE